MKRSFNKRPGSLNVAKSGLAKNGRQLKNQSGTALITVVLIAAVVIILVIESVKTVTYQKQLSSNLINLDQARSYLMGMEELAKIWLKRAFKDSKEDVVHLNQPWAQDNITFPLDGGGMTASIKDMQSCFNLNSIVTEANNQGRGEDGRSRDPNQRDSDEQEQERSRDNAGPLLTDDGFAAETPGQKMLEEVIEQVKESSDITGKALATAVRDWVDQDSEPAGTDGAEDPYYLAMPIPYRTGNGLIAHVSELRAMKDFSQKIYTAIMPYVCVIPDANVNKININTVDESAAVLVFSALGGKGITVSDVSGALSKRGDEGFATVDEFIKEFTSDERLDASLLSVSSDYFQMTAKAEIGNTRVMMKTLFRKDENKNFKVVSRYFGKD